MHAEVGLEHGTIDRVFVAQSDIDVRFVHLEGGVVPCVEDFLSLVAGAMLDDGLSV